MLLGLENVWRLYLLGGWRCNQRTRHANGPTIIRLSRSLGPLGVRRSFYPTIMEMVKTVVGLVSRIVCRITKPPQDRFELRKQNTCADLEAQHDWRRKRQEAGIVGRRG